MSKLIKRQDVIELIKNSHYDLANSEDDMWAMVADVEKLPVIEAVPVRHGRWTVTPTYIKCSECGESFMLYPQNYCPNCGARMDVE